MSIEAQFVDFTATGVLGAAWTATGGTFTQDGQRAYPTTPATYSRATLTAVPTLTASTPIKVRYEVDIILPATFPATGVLRAGLVFQGGYAHFAWTRSSGGGSTLFDFFARNATGTETSYFSASVSLAAGSTTRLRAEVRYQSDALIVTCSYSADGGQTFTPLWISTPTPAVWNTATGQSLTTFATADKRGGIVAQSAQVAVPPGPFVVSLFDYFVPLVDNFRVTDIGSLAASPTIDVAPAATAFPTLTPYTVSEEDDGGAEVLTVSPSWVMQLADVWEVVEHPFDGGYTATVARQTVRRREWRFHFDAMNAADTVAFGALKAAVHGTRAAFEWTDTTTGEVVRIRFVTDPTVSLVSSGVWQADAVVREVI